MRSPTCISKRSLTRRRRISWKSAPSPLQSKSSPAASKCTKAGSAVSTTASLLRGPRVRIRLLPAGNLQNATERLDTGNCRGSAGRADAVRQSRGGSAGLGLVRDLRTGTRWLQPDLFNVRSCISSRRWKNTAQRTGLLASRLFSPASRCWRKSASDQDVNAPAACLRSDRAA
jgi:hypothetical protein